jgi:signal transduction histidine kinase/ActR/RegA family two-component response regulator
MATDGTPRALAGVIEGARQSSAVTRLPIDTILASRDGEQRPITGGASASPDGSGTGGVTICFRDLAEERRAETDRVSLVSLVAQARTEVAAREHVEATLRETEDQLRHAQKMEAVGRLAGGAAHDFNNALSVILSYAELIMSELEPDDPIREDLTAIRHAGKRASELTRQLLLFSRHDMVQPQVLDMNEILVGTEKMLRRLVGEDVELVSLPAALDATVRVDPGSIEHMIMNLAVNARDAMPDGGKLTIATADATLDEAEASEQLGVKAGRYVCLSVSDSGTGMDLATQARMFEPFFTTKERGKGTGLGLSTVFGIVKQSGGHIRVDTEPGDGTTFHIYLPLVEDRAEDAAGQLVPRQLKGTETVLLVEDEEHVRSAARSILVRQGYRVLDAGTPEEALALARAHAGPIELLLSDVVMPQMSGPELATKLGADRPGTRILFMSGYSEDSLLRQRVADSGIALLQKPFTFDSLARRVREVLDSRAHQAGQAS